MNKLKARIKLLRADSISKGILKEIDTEVELNLNIIEEPEDMNQIFFDEDILEKQNIDEEQIEKQAQDIIKAKKTRCERETMLQRINMKKGRYRALPNQTPPHKEPHPLSRFYKTLISFYIIAIIAGSTLLCVFYFFLKDYEHSSKGYILNEIITQIYEDSFILIEDDLNEFEMARPLNTELDRYSDITYEERSATEYGIFSGKNLIANVTLSTMEQKSKFGFDVYEYSILPAIRKKSIKIVTNNKNDVFINGVKVEDRYITKQEHMQWSDEALAQYKTPEIIQYEVEGFFAEPKVTTQNSCKITREKNTYIIHDIISSKEVEDIIAVAKNTTNTYAKFISKDASKSELLAQLLEDSAFAKKIKGFDNSWYTEHDSFEFLKEKYGPVRALNESVFLCNVEFTYIIKRGNKMYDFPSKYTVVILRDSLGRYLTYDIAII